ncbi:trypsin-like peptidase domain-containing protein [Planococcus sp. APC 4015]|nr:trypsin-like peptidase domain-containing protein [Planococcus sp. APC 4015]
MSDTHGERPADQTPETPAPATPEQASHDHATPAADAPADAASQTPPAAAEATTPDAQPTEVIAPASSDVHPTEVIAPAAPPAPASPVAPASAAAWQVPARPAAPGPVPPGYVAQTPQAPRPTGYAGQQAPRPQYAGQPAYGAAFGAAATADAQPTLPIGPTGSVPVAGGAPKKQKSGAGKIVGLIVAAALVGGAAGLGGAYAGVNLFTPASTSPAAGPSTVTVNSTDDVTQTTGIAAKVLPSVVTIEAAGGTGSGTGSGVVLSADGYVVTNTHVVTLDGATGDAAIRVTTSDGRVFDAEVVGTDPTYDLAVIKLVDAEDLTPIDFADSSDLNVGDVTVAVGAPLGLANTVTTGIVSALNRSIEIASSAAPEGDAEEDGGDTGENEEDAPFQFDFGQGQQGGSTAESIKIAVIQTDAAINPGNSGGALVDGEGALIGINVAIASAGGSQGTSGSIGVGFAIPSNVVQRITEELIADGAATHGLLGASVQSAAYVEGASITGAYIASVVPGGAAAEGGLEEGDIVTAFNGVPITDSVDLTAQVRAAAAGSDATVTVVRDGRTQTLDVTLGELE